MSQIRLAPVAILLAIALLSHPARAQDKAASEPAKVQPVDFRKLKELMPDAAAGVQRSALSGENVSVGDMNMSKASADYTKPDADGSEPHASIEISDFGASPQMVAGMTAWRMVPINIENDDGHQRTAKVRDFPAFETYTRNGDTRQLMVLVAERFLVNVDCSHVSADDFKQLVEALPLEALAKLK